MFYLTTDYFLLKQLEVVIWPIVLPLLSFVVCKENYKLCSKQQANLIDKVSVIPLI